MRSDSRIFVAGHRGLVGSGICRQLTANGYGQILVRSHAELDLTDRKAVMDFFRSERPEHVFLAAAKVGGIHANDSYPADFIRENLLIQTNVIDGCFDVDVERLLFLGSSCIYPKLCPQPIREEYLLTGPLEATNQSYAVAKIAGIEQCWAYNRQYGTKFLAAMPANLYGPGDNFDPENSHVVAALIRKVALAKAAGSKQITIWGTGTPRRELLYSDDLAEGCVFLMQLPEREFDALIVRERPPMVNIGFGEDVTIHELAEIICRVLGFDGELVFDSTRPDGTPRKLLDVSRMRALGWQSSVSLADGIRRTYESAREILLAGVV